MQHCSVNDWLRSPLYYTWSNRRSTLYHITLVQWVGCRVELACYNHYTITRSQCGKCFTFFLFNFVGKELVSKRFNCTVLHLLYPVHVTNKLTVKHRLSSTILSHCSVEKESNTLARRLSVQYCKIGVHRQWYMHTDLINCVWRIFTKTMVL